MFGQIVGNTKCFQSYNWIKLENNTIKIPDFEERQQVAPASAQPNSLHFNNKTAEVLFQHHHATSGHADWSLLSKHLKSTTNLGITLDNDYKFDTQTESMSAFIFCQLRHWPRLNCLFLSIASKFE